MEFVTPIPEPRELMPHEVAKIESALKAGCTADESAAHAGVARRDYHAWAAIKAVECPTFFDDLREYSVLKSASRKVMESKVIERLPELVEGQISDAIGAEEGSVRNAARRDLLDRVHGKAVERVDVTTKGESVNRYTPEEVAKIEEMFGRKA